MKLKDQDFWQEYIKTVKKISKDKVAPPLAAWPITSEAIIQARLANKPIALKEGIPPVPLSRKDKRFFKPKAMIDLHGFLSSSVSSSLEQFCLNCMRQGIRQVLIITGKGEGIVKKETLHWLNSSPSYIIGFSPVMDSKKEVGSIAVLLRKLK